MSMGANILVRAAGAEQSTGPCVCSGQLSGGSSSLTALIAPMQYQPAGSKVRTHAACAVTLTATLSLCASVCCRMLLRCQFHRNPFHYRNVTVLKGGASLDEYIAGPCVVMATPSMLQSGLSRQLFEEWCESERNRVIICDFAVQGTLAREIQTHPTHILSKEGTRVRAPH